MAGDMCGGVNTHEAQRWSRRKRRRWQHPLHYVAVGGCGLAVKRRGPNV